MNTTPKIDLIIVGAQKAGTTSLNNYLCEHPQIIGHASIQKEFAYFRNDTIFNDGYEKAFHTAFSIPLHLNKRKKIIAKNAAIYNNETAIKRLYEHNPDGKVIFILREPISRTYSSYAMEVFNGWMKKDFIALKKIITDNDTSDDMFRFFIEPSLYINHIELLLKYFPENQIKIFLFEDLKSNPELICREIFEWLGIDIEFSPSINKKHNTTQKAKSKTLSKLIYTLKKEDNYIKKTVKNILPYSVFIKISNLIIESNKSTNKADKISPEMTLFLKNYFQPYNEKLKLKTKLPIDERWNNPI